MCAKTLGICIPTFNRSNVVSSLIKELLLCKDDRFEIIVCDNSTDNSTVTILENISDDRLRVYSNNGNIGYSNLTKVISLSNAKYSMLLLDKDRLDCRYISQFIDVVDAIDFSAGYVQLNYQSIRPNNIYKEGYQSISKMAFLSKHPSGYIYNTSFYKDSRFVKNIVENQDPFPFPFELINAELSQRAKTIIFNMPLIITESIDSVKKGKSKEFIGSNLYLLPENRTIHYLRYVSCLKELNLSNKNRIALMYKTFYAYLSLMTVGYRLLCADAMIAGHYDFVPFKVSFYTLCLNTIKSIKIFWKVSSDYLNFIVRIIVIVCSVARIILSYIKNCLLFKHR